LATTRCSGLGIELDAMAQRKKAVFLVECPVASDSYTPTRSMCTGHRTHTARGWAGPIAPTLSHLFFHFFFSFSIFFFPFNFSGQFFVFLLQHLKLFRFEIFIQILIFVNILEFA
jgi:hypothetical protein